MVNGEQQGPFTAQEIINKGFSNDSYIFNKGLGDWKKISEVAGFSSFEKKNEIKPETISSSILKNSDSSSVAVKSQTFVIVTDLSVFDIDPILSNTILGLAVPVADFDFCD